MLPTRRSQSAVSPSFNRGVIAETGVIPAGYKLLQDTFTFDVIDKKDIVVEGRDGNEMRAMRVAGLIQMGDRENANSRIYSTSDVLRPAVSNIQEDIKSRAVMGEYDHPQDAKIHLDRVSHLMTKVWMDGRKVFGEAEILHNLPCGACLRGLFEHKVRVGISSRGVGDMELVEHAGKELYRVMPGYAFVTWDAVAEPSVNGAILQIQEGLNKQIRPLKQNRHKFSPAVYDGMLVSAINKYFGLK